MHASPVAPVTGVAKGLGLAVACQVAAQGLTVVVSARSAATAARVITVLEGLDPLKVDLDTTSRTTAASWRPRRRSG